MLNDRRLYMFINQQVSKRCMNVAIFFTVSCGILNSLEGRSPISDVLRGLKLEHGNWLDTSWVINKDLNYCLTTIQIILLYNHFSPLSSHSYRRFLFGMWSIPKEREQDQSQYNQCISLLLNILLVVGFFWRRRKGTHQLHMNECNIWLATIYLIYN